MTCLRRGLLVCFSSKSKGKMLSAADAHCSRFLGDDAFAVQDIHPVNRVGSDCKPVSERTSEVGCWIIVHQPIGQLTSQSF